ncbi:MAG: DEAD/DEAH box helicase, partial [Acidobacteriota bacterium]
MSTSTLSIPDLVQTLRDHEKLGPELVYSDTLPGRKPRHAELADPLPPALREALAAGGVERLFSHQAEGIDAVLRGENVLVTTPTASGKSLVFHLPPLLEAAAGGPGRGLFLFPLKALGQDQRSKFDALARAAGLAPETARAAIYDGDTPRAERAAIRRDLPRVLVTNPDMLHLGVLSHWTGWSEYLKSLRWIVLDELHTYRGIFGSHFHHVLQRFLRVCRAEGAEPALIASSATAENAGEFAETLTGRPFRWISESGAPREARHMLLFRPEASPYTTALALLIQLLRSGAKTIVFTKARRITELLYSWLRRQDPELARRVASYRSGFLPEERRTIERRLFEGRLDGVISTSALEMGIDVGGLDACILVGYPGSVMATWQRSGRAGRGGRQSLTALVALPDALDQYFLDHPEKLLERPCERLIVDPANEPVTRAHLVCAAAELPLTPERDGGTESSPEADRGYWSRHAGLIRTLVDERLLLESADGSEVFSPARRPQRHVNLRGGGETYDIVHAETGEMIGTVDGVRVLHECHPGAIYLHGGRQHEVAVLDLDRRHVLVHPGRFEYFTTPLTEKETEIREVLDERRDGDGLVARLGRLQVTERVVGYERKRIQTQEVLGQHPLELPPVQFETVGLWWVAPRSFEETLRREAEHFLGALHACEHAAISLFPTLALCDRGDIGGISYHRHPQVGSGAVFVYDGHPGGVGIAARGFRDLPELLGRVLALLDGCD